jgi:hypothetical protein
MNGIWQLTDDIQIIKKHHPQEDAQALLNSYIFVTEKSHDTFSGYSSDGKLRKLSNKIIGNQINKKAHIYDIISLDNSNLQLHWQNSIQTKMSLMTISKNNLFSLSTVTLN